MNPRSNPFEDLYVSETVPPKDFVRLFSPFLVGHALPLFQPGNVILKGVQGSGKTMLLSLLRPQIRIAYAEAGVPFPVPPEVSRFVAAGINLRRHGAMEFGQRQIDPDPEVNAAQFPLYFGDFFNYRIIDDLLTSIEFYCGRLDGRVAHELGISVKPSRVDDFATELADDPSWFGYLDDCRTYRQLRERLRGRIHAYLAYLNFNTDDLSPGLRSTKSTIGVPIRVCVEKLWASGVLPQDVNVYVRVDQYEEMGTIAPAPLRADYQYQRVLNKAFGMRDSYVSYRVGTRRYGWREDLVIHGTTAVLEGEREYNEVDIDTILRRAENRRTWIFPRFALDVFTRRLEFANYELSPAGTNALRYVLGSHLPPDEKAAMYVKLPREHRAHKESHGAMARIVGWSADWPHEWKEFLANLAYESPLSAKLCDAWLRQRRGQRPFREGPPTVRPFPWERMYWKKERIQQALAQIAAAVGQRTIWAGADEVLNLSGGNVLVFVSICRSVWDAWIRGTAEDKESTVRTPPKIEPTIQSVGIDIASGKWYDKMLERRDGHKRQRFIDLLARQFQHELLDDKAMSYPGHNGFSIANDELHDYPMVADFLHDAVDFGDLVDAPHTTKEANRRQRTKWYVMPVLSPALRIPATHVKEPIYVTAAQVRDWIAAAVDNKPVVDDGQRAQQLQIFRT